MKTRNQKIALSILIIIIIILIAFRQITPKLIRYLERRQIVKENTSTMNSITEKNIIRKNEIEESTPSSDSEQESQIKIQKNIQLLSKAYLEVQFICQAPLETEENWTYHEESCEEAALLQAYLYETDQSITKEEANEIILDMIDWQEENFGGHYDIYADKVKEFAMGYYGLQDTDIEIINDATLDDIKKLIVLGHPVIVPITGEILQNPYYPHPGYHMLIVIGYTEDKIITNDNGTRRGKDFSYDYDIFEEAMNDAGGDIVILEL
jgi:hypothetical protein